MSETKHGISNRDLRDYPGGASRGNRGGWSRCDRPQLVPTSKRRVTREQAREICAATPAGILKVGVFANAPLSEMVECLEKLPLDLVQLHGAETLDAYQELARAIGAGAYRAHCRPGSEP
ncbi:MAG: hypothetical protein R3B96_19530 [Pirellulaceae bacterium]